MLFAALLGVMLGLIAGYVGGRVDALIMRIADVQLSFPAILIALLIDGVGAVGAARDAHRPLAIPVLIVVHRPGRLGAVCAHRARLHAGREEQGVRAGGAGDRRARRWESCCATCCRTCWARPRDRYHQHRDRPIITEATLSFLGVGVPPTTPSLGTLIRIGNDYLFAGEWWIVVFPGVALVVLVPPMNLLGDWLRDALNPKLR